MKTALITGANKGIGFEIARQLGQRNFRIFISGRNETKLQEAHTRLQKAGVTVDLLHMDVSDTAGIKKAAKEFAAQQIKLDVLINNAAILLKNDNRLASDSDAVFEETFRTNVHGPLLVIKTFLPYMNNPARIINISSAGGSMSEPVGGWSPAYCVSKTALNGLTRHLAAELVSRNISINAVNPGWVKTDMGGSGAPRTVEKGAETPVWLASEAGQELTGLFFTDKKKTYW